MGLSRPCCGALWARSCGCHRQARSAWLLTTGFLCFHRLDVLVSRFLCLKNKSSASVVFTTYTQKHPSIEDGPPFVQPLLNFIWFLLLAVDG